MNKRKYLGFLGFLGFQGIAPLLRGDWIGAVWLVWFVWFLYFVIPFPETEDEKNKTLNEERAAAKHAAVEKVFAEIQQRGTMTNDEVQALLSVSDATAERYLQELETAGRITQVGREGKSVSYKIQ